MDLIIHPFSVDSCSIFCAWKKKKIGLRRFSVSTQLLCYLSLETQQEKKRLCDSLHCHEFDVTVLGCAAVGKTRRHWLKRNRRAWRFPVDLTIWNLFLISIPVHTLLRIWLMFWALWGCLFSLITKSRDAQAYLNYSIKDKNDLWKKAHSCLRTCASKRERLEPSALIMQQVVRMRPSSALFVLCVHLMYTYTSEGVRECVYVCVFNV